MTQTLPTETTSATTSVDADAPRVAARPAASAPCSSPAPRPVSAGPSPPRWPPPAAARCSSTGCPVDDGPDGSLAAVADLADTRAAEDAVRALIDRAGGLDAVVTAAGTDRCGALADVPAAEWERVVAVNLLGTAAVVRAALPALQASRGKHRHRRLDARACGRCPTPAPTARRSSGSSG